MTIRVVATWEKMSRVVKPMRLSEPPLVQVVHMYTLPRSDDEPNKSAIRLI